MGKAPLAFGLALGGTLIALERGTISPYVGGVLWFVSFASLAHGVWQFGWNRWIRVTTLLVALVLAFFLWHERSPRADIRVYEIAPAPGDKERPDFIDVNIRFRNQGQWDADIGASFSRIGLFTPESGENVSKRREIEEVLTKDLANAAADRLDSPIRLAPDESRVFTVSRAVSREQMAAYKSRQLMVFVVSRIPYHDWWIRERGTRVCRFWYGSQQPTVQCLSHNDSW